MNFEFIDEGNAVTIIAGETSKTIPKNKYSLLTTEFINQNKVLYIAKTDYEDLLFKIDLNIDTVSGVGAGSTTADELKTA